MGTLTLVHKFTLTSSNFINTNKSPSLLDSLVNQLTFTNLSHTHTTTSRRTRIKPKKMAAATADAAADRLVQNPGVQQKKIIIQNNYGEKLVGVLHETGSKEMVILCHGFQCNKDYMTDLALACEQHAISAFRFDFSGNGESEGSFEFGNYCKEVDDLHAVIQHFTAENHVISAILGHSKGGNVVLLYASLHRDVKTVVNVSGRYKMDWGIEERLGKDYLQRAKQDGFIDIKSKAAYVGEVSFRVTLESLMERLNTNMHEACLRIDKDCKVLTVHGSDDEIIPVEDALEFAKIVPNHKLQILQGANHGFTKHRDELAAVVLSFIEENLHSNKE